MATFPCTASPFTFLLPNISLASPKMGVFPNRFSGAPKVLNLVSKSHSDLVLNTRACVTPVTQEPSESTKKELNVTIHKSFLITPETKTERKSVYLSNLDFCYNYQIAAVFFFSKHPDFTPEMVVQTLETALRKVLVSYDFGVGRLRPDQNGRLEVDCNSAGAGFVVASCESSLDELGDGLDPDPHYAKLAVRKLRGFQPHDQPLFVVQITSFKCGGFSIGMSGKHILSDGISVKLFLENVASVARNKPMRIVPQNNRSILSPRSPPQVKYTHPEIYKRGNPVEKDKPNVALLSSSAKKIEFKAFRLSTEDIIYLKEKAKMGGEGVNKNVTDFNVIAAHVWRCIALAKTPRNEHHDKKFSLMYAVNIRTRLRPRLPSSYAGNGIYVAYCTTTCEELEKGPFSRLVQQVAQADKQVTDDYVRSAIDKLNMDTVYGDVFITAWWKLGVIDTVYPWGKPKWIAPVLHKYGSNAVMIVPNPQGEDGVSIIMSLQPKEMEKFHDLFYTFLGK